MYKIERKPWGFKITFGGFVQKSEMEEWVKDSANELSKKAGKFGVFVDMRELKPLMTDAQDAMTRGQVLYKEKGLERSVVVVNNPTTKLQFMRLAKKSGIYQWERYIDSSTVQNWEQVGLDWIRSGKDPDQ